MSSLRKMVGGDNLQRLKITKDDYLNKTSIQWKGDTICNLIMMIFRYNTKLHKKMYKIDTRLTVKLNKEVGIQRRG